jgi:hypothetical protein
MNKVPLITALIAAACALPAASADAKKLPSKSYFRVQVVATQDINWSVDVVAHSCGGGAFHTIARSESKSLVTTAGWQPVTVRRVKGNVLFSFKGGTSEAPATGHLERNGDQQTTVNPVPPPGACPKPIPTARDCGTRTYPAGTKLIFEWNRPKDWPYRDDPTPLAPSLHLIGPNVPNQTLTMGFRNCPGERDDYGLGVNAYPDPGFDSGPAALPLKLLFGKRKQFTVRERFQRTVPGLLQPNETGFRKSAFDLNWTVKFERLSHPGKAPAPLKPAPLT